MPSKAPSPRAAHQKDLILLLRAIAARDKQRVAQKLLRQPGLAQVSLSADAVAQCANMALASGVTLKPCAGDTALHLAAAAHSAPIAQSLIALGAEVHAKNLRGASPLHYAAEANPGSTSREAARQQTIIEHLMACGATADAQDRRGVTPLHRAVRSRSAAAVSILLAAGADPRRPNARGSTPLHLAVQNTGRAGAGSMAARYQQRGIIALLLKYGARVSDMNAAGRDVRECARADWLKEIFLGI